MLHRFVDIHTHVGGRPLTILSTPIDDVERIALCNSRLTDAERQYYSLQLHPWHLKGLQDITAFIDTAEHLRHDPQMVAIGECGLDALCSTPIGLQHKAFIAALSIARDFRLPVIVHCVRLWGDMICDVHQVFPELRSDPDAWQQWPVIIHGYRRGTQLAQQLLDAGFSLSLGEKYHPDVAKMLPEARRYAESDQE